MLKIWNMALSLLGARAVISEDETTQEATQCRLFWDSARRQILRDYPWPFALRRGWLARLPLPEDWEGEYAHAFALPTDCLKVLALRGGMEGQWADSVSLPWTLAYHSEAARQTLLCNADAALLTYIADVRDVALYSGLFVHLLERRLAALMAAPPLCSNFTKAREMEERYYAELRKHSTE